MDVCLPRAIDMRPFKKGALEGTVLSYLALNSDRNPEVSPQAMATFPFMARADYCDGCMVCVNQCPTSALELQ
jgi:ferredoxin